jgi:hypothetical protein
MLASYIVLNNYNEENAALMKCMMAMVGGGRFLLPARLNSGIMMSRARLIRDFQGSFIQLTW